MQFTSQGRTTRRIFTLVNWLVAAACSQIGQPPTGPLPDCDFKPATEFCGREPRTGPPAPRLPF